jgi:hypothetical protein
MSEVVYPKTWAFIRASGCNVALIDGPTNDVATAASYATIVANMGTLKTKLNDAGIRVKWSTIIPRTTSTDNWVTTTNQSYASGFAPSGVADQINTGIKNNTIAGDFSGTCIDLQSVIGDASLPMKWGVGYANGASVTADGIHPVTLPLIRVMQHANPWYDFLKEQGNAVKFYGQ